MKTIDMLGWPRITLVAVALLLAAGQGDAHAQATARARAACTTEEAVGWIGLERFQCNCTVSTEGDDEPQAQWSFRSEPVVRSVVEGSPAANVLRPGDVIVAVDGHLITTAEGGRRFSFPEPGERLALRIRRSGREMVVRLTPLALCPTDTRLGSQAPRARSGVLSVPSRATLRQLEPPEPPQPMAAASLLPAGRLGFGFSCSSCGWTSPRSGERRLYFDGPLQVYSVEPGSPADRAGLRRGDVITHVDGLALGTEEGARRFGSTEPDETVRYTVRRGASTDIVTLRAAERDGGSEGMSSRELRERLERIARMRDVDDVRREIVALARQLDAEAAVGSGGADEGNRLRYSGQIGDAEVEVRGAAPVIATVLEANRDLRIVTSQTIVRIRIPRDGGR